MSKDDMISTLEKMSDPSAGVPIKDGEGARYFLENVIVEKTLNYLELQTMAKQVEDQYAWTVFDYLLRRHGGHPALAALVEQHADRIQKFAGEQTVQAFLPPTREV